MKRLNPERNTFVFLLERQPSLKQGIDDMLAEIQQTARR